MKRSRQTSSSAKSSPLNAGKLGARTEAELRGLQRAMSAVLFGRLRADWGMQKVTADGRKMTAVADSFIKANDRLSSFERLEIYNRQYWFRLLDCLYDDYPGLRAVLGERKFMRLITAYLEKYPSRSYALRDLGSKLERFIAEEPGWVEGRYELALDMVRFEWAQVVAFDEAALTPITADDVLGKSDLKLRLQPYISFLALNHPVDEFLLAIKKEEALRSEASNAVEVPRSGETGRAKKVRLPKKEPVTMAVHRHDNMIYFKRLEPEEFQILRAIKRGALVESACSNAIAKSRRENADWGTLIRDWFANWSSLGWLCARV